MPKLSELLSEPQSDNFIGMDSQGGLNLNALLQPLLQLLQSDKASQFLFGKEGEAEQLPTLLPGQQQLLGGLTGGLEAPQQQALSYLSQLLSGDPEAISAFEAPVRRQFEQEIIPGLAERFGGMGAQGSSGFQRALGGAGADLATNLASLRANLRSGAVGQLQNLLGGALGTRAFENIYKPEQPGFLQAVGSGLGQGLGKAGTAALL